MKKVSDKPRPLFALLFSDLMMGSMGVVIVLLIFLQVVTNRGFGDHESIGRLNLPPGLREGESFSLVRLRLYDCSGDLGGRIGISDGDGARYYWGAMGGCNYKIWVFDRGLSGDAVDIVAEGEVARGVKVYLVFSIGGFSVGEAWEIGGELVAGDVIGRVSLRHPRVLYRL